MSKSSGLRRSSRQKKQAGQIGDIRDYTCQGMIGSEEKVFFIRFNAPREMGTTEDLGKGNWL